MASDLNKELSEKTSMFGLKVWVLMGIFVGVFIVVILVVLWICLTSHKKSKRPNGKLPLNQIPTISKEIKEIKIDQASANNSVAYHDLHDKYTDKDSNKLLSNPNKEKMHHCDNCSQTGSSDHVDKKSKDSGYMASSHPASTPSSLSGLHEFSHLGWCHWFTLRELHIAANRFSKDNIIGDGGYGVVYRGFLVNGTPVAIKRLLLKKAHGSLPHSESISINQVSRARDERTISLYYVLHV